MKKISFMIAALLVAMTGCQKEPQVNPENNGSNAEGVGYVALKISLPSSVGTKADTNFSDGSKEEYDVKDLTIVFYAEDLSYCFHTTTATPDPWNTQNPADDNITYTGKTPAIEVTNPNAKYALVLINSKNVFSEGWIANKTYTEVIAAAGEMNVSAVTKDGEDPYFFMSNAPYKYANGGYQTLVPVNIKPTEAQALSAAAEVKVERAAAKVTVRYAHAQANNMLSSSYGEASIIGWDLDVTNKALFPVRQIDEDWLTADISNGSLLGESGRIYWAKDPNYSVNYDTFSNDNFDRISDVTGAFAYVDEGYAYCLENTFNTTCMDENQTTTVMIKAEYVPADFTPDADGTWFMVGSGKTVYSTAGLVDYIESKLTADQLETLTAGLETKLSENAGEVEDFIVADKNSVMLNALVGDVICYKKGICYYPVKIRHFSDSDLNYSDTEFKERFESTPGYTEAKDLGRYGVLRNTWYQISINSISNPGSPVIPDPTDTPDDKFEQYVACTIDILAWSVRNHGVNL